MKSTFNVVAWEGIKWLMFISAHFWVFLSFKNKSLLLLHTSVQTNAELCCKKWCYNSDLMSKYKSRAKHVKRTILGNGNHMVETAHDLYDLPRIFLLRPSVIHHQTRHAGWCCRQLNTLYGISRLFHICHMLNVNLLSAVKRIGYQWWVCQFWCSLTNANETA